MTAGIGHNRGPALQPGAGFRKHAWGRARTALLGNRLPLQVIRARVRRAEALGLSYPVYASALKGPGAILWAFCSPATGWVCA